MIHSIHTRVSQMEPMLPSTQGPALADLAVEVVRRSAALGGGLHPVTRRSVAEVVRVMNSYYSNLIEGHHTHPIDIERALAKDYLRDPAQRALQMESAAHVEVQRLIEAKLAAEPATDVCAFAFLSWVHREFYARLSEEFRRVEAPNGEVKIVAPGELRRDEVTVGRHVAPACKALPEFLARFQTAYGGSPLSAVEQVVAAAAAHHRLAWIHPFLDGNGRVTRLFTHAYLVKTRLDGQGLWTVSRGLARSRAVYLAALAGADEPRRGDLDGRGNLSDQGLSEFCAFFLHTALDQISFMTDLLDLDGLQKRIVGYVERQTSYGALPIESIGLLRETLLRGEVPRGEASRITGRPERTARRILRELLDQHLLTADTEKGPVRLALPVKVAGYYFPRLYPEGSETI